MKKEGFTLLEIIVSMMILSIVVAGSFGMMVTTNKMLVNAEHRLQAVNQGQAVLEKLRSYVSAEPVNPDPFDTVNCPHDPVNMGLFNGPPSISNVDAPKWEYGVSSVSGSRCRHVDVTVTWGEL